MVLKRKRARQAREDNTFMGAEGNDAQINKEWKTQFVGHSDLIVSDANILAIIVDNQFVDKQKRIKKYLLF